MNIDDPIYLAALHKMESLFAEAKKISGVDASSMTLATVDEQNRPSVRTINLKHFDPQGFVFYTNQYSRKGEHLAKNPHAAMCFYWAELQTQITIEGEVHKLDEANTENYWNKRSRENQIAAWASKQSQRLHDRKQLIQQLDDLKNQFRDQAVPRPDSWLGYRLQATRIEFWKYGWQRISERDCYETTNGQWENFMLYP